MFAAFGRSSVGRTWVPYGNEHLSGPADHRSCEAIGKKYEPIVCYINAAKPENRGTGVLIGPAVVLTCNHVLPRFPMDAGATALFNLVQHANAQGNDFTFRRIGIQFESMLNSCQGPLDEQNNSQLDFSVLRLRFDPYLIEVSKKHEYLSVFSAIPLPQSRNRVYALHYPAPPGNQGPDQIKYTVHSGEVQEVVAHVVYHSAITFPGSSGGAILNSSGEFFAMHCQANTLGNAITGWRGVLTREIASRLDRPDIDRSIEDLYAGDLQGLDVRALQHAGLREKICKFIAVLDCNYPIPFVLIKARFEGYNNETLHEQIQRVPGIKGCSNRTTYWPTGGTFADMQSDMTLDEKMHQTIEALSPLCTLISRLNPEDLNYHQIAGYFVPHASKVVISLQNERGLIDGDQFSFLSSFLGRYYGRLDMLSPGRLGKIEAEGRDVVMAEGEAEG